MSVVTQPDSKDDCLTVNHFTTDGSAAVLFGIRFKKEWSKVCPDNILGRKTFIYCVTFEWLLGIGLIVTFALLVKGARFGFIRDLLGF